ncbi:MAG: hypothetical protein IGS48_16595 [Oscillatoriales cyanobacterium C42_A2020_001]|nr:hypothetical protein [Leptolyngbyaceae cyanobacterium C42_A2020_001]
MSSCGEVLVAIMNNRADWAIASEQHWYRIPIEQVEKLKQRNQWPPKWLAFYQTKAFGDEAHAVTYYAEVIDMREVSRVELFPLEAQTAKSHTRYYKLEFATLQRLSHPIKSQRLRRITFIPTTLEKLHRATQIEEL